MSQMVPNGFKLYQVILNGLKWFQVIPNGFKQFKNVSHDAQHVPNHIDENGDTIWTLVFGGN